MERNYVTLASFWGREVKHRHISNNSKSLVVLFPGKNYPCELPLLYYSSQSAIENNHDVLLLEYGYQSARTDLEYEDIPILVDECKKAIQQVKEPYSTLVFVSKSLGTVISGKVAEELIDGGPIKQLFLTPLNETVPYIQNSNCLVIYGTNDPQFSQESRESIEGFKDVQVHSFLNGTHSLEVGSVNESLNVLKEIVELYGEFFKDIG